MSQSYIGPEIERLIQLMARLPGLGPRSARRSVLHLIKRKEALFSPLTEAMQVALDSVKACNICGNIDTKSPCGICTDPRRSNETLVVIEDVTDLWALERAVVTSKNRYHVLGGTLSPLDGIGPEDLNIPSLINRCEQGDVKEIILAVNATIDGQTTAHYISDCVQGFDLKISRLAHGVPVGGELDYLDEGTLSQAIKARSDFG